MVVGETHHFRKPSNKHSARIWWCRVQLSMSSWCRRISKPWPIGRLFHTMSWLHWKSHPSSTMGGITRKDGEGQQHATTTTTTKTTTTTARRKDNKKQSTSWWFQSILLRKKHEWFNQDPAQIDSINLKKQTILSLKPLSLQWFRLLLSSLNKNLPSKNRGRENS